MFDVNHLRSCVGSSRSGTRERLSSCTSCWLTEQPKLASYSASHFSTGNVLNSKLMCWPSIRSGLSDPSCPNHMWQIFHKLVLWTHLTWDRQCSYLMEIQGGRGSFTDPQRMGDKSLNGAPRGSCLARHHARGGVFVMLRWIFSGPPPLCPPHSPSPRPHECGASSDDIHSRREWNNTEPQSPAGYFGSSFSSCGHTVTFIRTAWPPDDGGKVSKRAL